MPSNRPRRIWNSLMLLALLGSAYAACAQPLIEKQMTPEQFKATGLDKLSPVELAKLNAWLQAEPASRTEDARAPVSSSLKGDFRGWQNGSVFELENGQRWRVVDSDFQAIEPLTNPKVVISPGAFGSWYMLVEGTSVKAKVKRIDL